MNAHGKSRHGEALVDQINIKFDQSPTDQQARAMASQLAAKRGNLSSAVKVFLCALAQIQEQTGVEVTVELLSSNMFTNALIGTPMSVDRHYEEPDVIISSAHRADADEIARNLADQFPDF